MKILTGIQASGNLHIGNYLGVMKKIIKESQENNNNEIFTFIANYHSLTTVTTSKYLKEFTINAVIDFLALGLNYSKINFWVQSDVKEVLELYWILSNFTSMGLLERGHSYKDKVANGISSNHSLFSYPVLMASDILLFNIDKVPIGKDQIQHIEMARDIAIKFNNKYGNIFTVPEYIIEKDLNILPGTDGQKMSKSYENTIDIFSDENLLKKQCNKIITSSVKFGEILDYKNCNIYKIASSFLNEKEKINLQNRYISGKYGYGHLKKYLQEIIWEEFREAREKKIFYQNNIQDVSKILKKGSEKVSQIASKNIEKIRNIVGLNY